MSVTEVWCVGFGAYDSYEIVAVFSTKDAAEAFCEERNRPVPNLRRGPFDFYSVSEEPVPVDPLVHAATA
jgi:hypothetical protein